MPTTGSVYPSMLESRLVLLYQPTHRHHPPHRPHRRQAYHPPHCPPRHQANHPRHHKALHRPCTISGSVEALDLAASITAISPVLMLLGDHAMMLISAADW